MLTRGSPLPSREGNSPGFLNVATKDHNQDRATFFCCTLFKVTVHIMLRFTAGRDDRIKTREGPGHCLFFNKPRPQTTQSAPLHHYTTQPWRYCSRRRGLRRRKKACCSGWRAWCATERRRSWPPTTASGVHMSAILPQVVQTNLT